MSVDVINDLALMVVKITVLSSAVTWLVQRSRNTSSANLHGILLITLWACALLPLVQIALPVIPIALLPRSLVAAATIEMGFTSEVHRPGIIALALLAYLGVSLCMLVRWLVECLRLDQLKQRAQPLNCGELSVDVQTLQRQVGVARRVDLYSSPEIRVPITWGWRRPTIVLPSTHEAWPETQLAHVLLHELAHIRRGDWASRAASYLVMMLYWPLPGLWSLRARLLWQAELACDDQVLRSGVSRAAYAESLLYFAGAAQGQRLGAGNGLLEGSQVHARISAVLDGTRVYGSSPRVLLGFAAAGLAIVLPLAALRLAAYSPAPSASEHWVTVRFSTPPTLLSPQSQAPVTLDLEALRATAQGVAATPKYPLNVAALTVGDEPSVLPLPDLPPSEALTPVLELPPRRLDVTPVAYPRRALARGREGQVRVVFDLTPLGQVVNERIVEPAAEQSLNQAALQAVRQFRYSPLYINGQPVATTEMEEVFRFEIGSR